MKFLIRPQNIFPWVILAFIVKLLFGIYLHHLNTVSSVATSNYFFIILNDHHEFFKPINNLIENGQYSMGETGQPYAGRLPGYIFPYILFRYFLNEQTALLLLGLFQLLCAGISTYFIARLSYELSSKKSIYFYITYIAFLFIPYFWHYDFSYHPTTLNSTVYILFLYFFYTKIFTSKPQIKYYIINGIFLAWIFFLRPFLGLYFIPALTFIIFQAFHHKIKIKKIILRLVIFMLPFILFESIWITRNHIAFNKFIPFQTSFVPFSSNEQSEYGYGSTTKYSMTHVRKLISAWGGDCTWYFNNSDMAWFLNTDSLKPHPFKDYTFCQGLTIDSLTHLKKVIYHSYHNDFSSTQKKDSLEKIIITTADRYRDTYIKERKVRYLFFSPLLRIKNFLIRNVTQDWPGKSFSDSSIINKFFRLLSLAEYYMLLIFGLILIITLPIFYKRYNGFELFVLSNVLILLITFAFLIELSHYIYFVTGYISLIILCSSFMKIINVKKHATINID